MQKMSWERKTMNTAESRQQQYAACDTEHLQNPTQVASSYCGIRFKFLWMKRYRDQVQRKNKYKRILILRIYAYLYLSNFIYYIS